MADKIILYFQQQIIPFIFEPNFIGIFLFIKTVFVAVSLILIISIVVLIFINSWLKFFVLEDFVETFIARPYGVKKSFKQWSKIQKRMAIGKEEEYKLALIEADALLEDVLKINGYKGESIVERLKNVDKNILPNLDEVGEAHKVRDNIVYDPDYKLSLEVAKRALAIYQKALQDLEAF